MSAPVRILHVFGRLDRGGAETMVMNLYRSIDRQKLQFDFVVHTQDIGDYEQEVLELGGAVYRAPRYKGYNDFSYRKWWRHFFSEHPQYQIIHGHMYSTASIYLKVAKRAGLYTIAHSHSTSNGTGVAAFVKNILQRGIRNTADMFFACSKESGIWLFGDKIYTSGRCRVIYNAIDTAKFSFNPQIREEMRNMLGIGENAIVLGHVGRFWQVKNHPFIIQVFLELIRWETNAKLLLLGDGPDYEMIQNMVQAEGIAGQVIFAGAQHNVHDYLQAMDVFIFPSHYEGLSLSLVEAQTAGLPCLISENVNLDICITDLVEALPADFARKCLWVEKIHEIAGRPRKSQESAVREAGYDIDTSVLEIEDFYLDVYNKRTNRTM